jgi:hypothetical protein
MQTAQGKFSAQVHEVRQQIEHGELAFQDSLSPKIVEGALERHKLDWRERIYTPWTTLTAFVNQVLSQDQCCKQVVRWLMAHRLRRGEEVCAPTTSSYCEARSRLPEQFYSDLVKETGRRASAEAPEAWLFKTRPVKVLDGTTVSMPETEANVEEYPLADPDRKGISYPIARLLVIFSLSVGTVLDYMIRPYQGKGTGELSMFTQLSDTFEPGEIALGDRAFCSYGHVALLRKRSVDVLVKLNKSRDPNLEFVKRLRKNDDLYRWHKPKEKPETLTDEEWDSLPDEILVRLVTVYVNVPGFRTKEFEVVTTILDPREISASEIGELYFLRWKAELCLRDIKATLKMDFLRCRTPAMVRKEIAAHLLGYNLIRIHIAQAAACRELHPYQISFKGAVQTLAAFAEQRQNGEAQVLAIILATIGCDIVGKRPGRFEPRCVKQRNNKYDNLTEPRQIARKRLLKAA